MTDNNPLLQEFNTPHQTPPFTQIQTAHYIPAFTAAMEEGRAEIKAIIDNPATPDFNNTIEALEKAGNKLSRISSIFFNLNSAETSEAIQEVAREVSPLLSEYGNDIWLNEALFARVKAVYEQKDKLTLSTEQATLLDNTYKGFVRRGALLNAEDKQKYRNITAELSKLSLQFGENLLAETNDYKLHITDEADLAGLPEAVREAAQQLAESEGKEGWMFSLHAPSMLPFMQYADQRELREQLFRASTKRGNQDNQNDNKANILRQAELRLAKAQLLGYRSHADYVLEERMAQSADKVNAFLNELFEKSFPFAQEDVAQVAAFAKQQGLEGELQRWDFAYYSEKLKTSLFDLNEEMTKPYFQLEKVKAGIFDLTNKLWGLSYKLNKDIPVYHPDVFAYEVFNRDEQVISVLYLDFHPRKGKQGGAWMTSFRDQHVENGQNIIPHVSVVCNFTPPTASRPSLLTFNEVTTFLHEFGHALHGMLSEVTYESLSGTSVYRDFVELPSQIMENWALEKEWLQDVAVHYQTGETMPEDLIQKIIAADNFQSGYLTVRQLSFGFNDMAWHSITEPVATDAISFEKAAMAKTELFPEVAGSCFSTAFGHIFDGGYAAGYYGYKWAEVLDADAYALFKEKGIFDQATAESFREHILSKGGTRHPMDLYVAFRGAEPSVEALLLRSGLSK
ncbi:M3 family metallopeptidase [Geofilum rhodophaeum]|uniref:M3 family metallopeptidase n=1 Tax=Geofilum rhodophaeum TaxID=1965019 RepID=UPI000B522866|nr:M3 family metallopeptidase [Geofilum rhodophaeum]